MLTLKRMHHMKRTITALIAALVLAPTVGCGNDEFGTDDFNWDDIPVNEEAGPPPVDGPTNPVKILKKIPDCKLEPGSEHGTADINGNLFASCDLELASVAHEFRHLAADDPRRENYVAMRTETENMLAEVIEAGRESGEFRFDEDIKDVLRYLFGACQAVTTWYRPSGARTPAEVARSYALISLRVVGAQNVDHLGDTQTTDNDSNDSNRSLKERKQP